MEGTLKRHLSVNHIIDGDSAEVTVHSMLVVEGETIPRVGATADITDVLRKIDGSWKVARHYVAIDPPWATPRARADDMADVAIVGATGQIGTEVVRLLHAKGALIRALVRDPARAADKLPPTVELVPGTLQDDRALGRLIADVPALFVVSSDPASEPAVFEAAGAAGVTHSRRAAGRDTAQPESPLPGRR